MFNARMSTDVVEWKKEGCDSELCGPREGKRYWQLEWRQRPTFNISNGNESFKNIDILLLSSDFNVGMGGGFFYKINFIKKKIIL
jgi:hypothetical protein